MDLKTAFGIAHLDDTGLAEAPELVLCSASPRRHRIMDALGVRHVVASVDVDEVKLRDDPELTVRENALRKNVAARAIFPDRWILTADTVVELGGVTLGKPRDFVDALRMITSYSGRTQKVYTGVSMSLPGDARPRVRVAVSEVTFKIIDDKLATEYLSTLDYLGRAGAYDIDTNGWMIIDSYAGSCTNIMGLPGELVADWLRELLAPNKAIREEMK